jgi:hypothetical protein
MNKTLPEDFADLRNRLINDARLWFGIVAVPGEEYSHCADKSAPTKYNTIALRGCPTRLVTYRK